MRRARFVEAVYALTFLLPYLLTLLVFFVFAFLRTFYFSFTDYDLFHSPKWVGLANYLALFREPLFVQAFKNTLAYALIVTLAQTVLALGLAAVLNQKLVGITFFRTVYYIPSILSSAAVTLIFLWLYQRKGFVNFASAWILTYAPILATAAGLFLLLQALQVIWERRRGLPVHFFDPALATVSLLLAGAGTALLWWFGVVEPRSDVVVNLVWLNTRRTWLGIPIPLWAIILQNVYTTVPTFMLLYLAGLQDVPKNLYEAAAIDGATPWQQFRYVTVPLLRPLTFLVITLGLIGTLQLFDQVALFGSAAPLESKITLAYYVYNNVFPSAATPRVGDASAAAIVLALLTLVVVLLQRRFGVSERGF